MVIRSKKLRYEIVKDPVYGYIKLYDHELKIINTSVMQRLRRIKQLSSAHFVYPGATHTRFSHSIGAMHIAGIYTEKLLEPLVHDRTISRGEAQRYVLMMRLWGLTHDLGHGPFSHVFETAVLNDFSITHEHMSAKVLKEDPELQKCMEKIERKFNISTKQMTELLTKPREEWTTTKRIGRSEHFESAFYWVLKGFYSADTIEYLLRDSMFTGAGFVGFDWQRLLFTSRLYGGRVVLEKRAVEALDAFLLSRLLMFDTVYYHRTTRAFDKILIDFFNKAKEKLNFKEYIEDVELYKELDDNILYNQELTGIKERELILHRKNIYSRIDEKRIIISPDQPKFFPKLVTERDWNSDLREVLGNDYPPDAFFIDSSNIPLNPMSGETRVFLLNTVTGEIEEREIFRTFWGEIPRVMYILRLYVNKRYKRLTNKLKAAFKEILEAEEGFKYYA